MPPLCHSASLPPDSTRRSRTPLGYAGTDRRPAGAPRLRRSGPGGAGLSEGTHRQIRSAKPRPCPSRPGGGLGFAFNSKHNETKSVKAAPRAAQPPHKISLSRVANSRPSPHPRPSSDRSAAANTRIPPPTRASPRFSVGPHRPLATIPIRPPDPTPHPPPAAIPPPHPHLPPNPTHPTHAPTLLKPRPARARARARARAPGRARSRAKSAAALPG